MNLDFLEKYDFFTGVPDSYLKAVCDYLMEKYGVSKQHVIAANEGNAVGLAAGYHLATGKIPVVYLQNSGIGNILNPVSSLMHEKVYRIPCLYLVGWRGEPETKDEPQHIHQGVATVSMLESGGISVFFLKKSTLEDEFKQIVQEMEDILSNGGQVALVVSKGGLEYPNSIRYSNQHTESRESVLEMLLNITKKDPIVSTTGKSSRELYELREKLGEQHQQDFLTVGSMGHSSSIALGLAENCPDKTVWCLDGDGAMLMHLGGAALVGQRKPNNLIHILLNNESHESVGGAPTISKGLDWCKIAEGCGYPNCWQVSTLKELNSFATMAKNKGELCFIEVKCGIGSRENLGRPKESPQENKKLFMEFLKG
ncbi:MAG: phosphonopyruvate decarboxylase [Eubacteriales bacterium]